MVGNYLNKIFLSASIPSPERDKRYYETADIAAIRDSVRALATVVIPNAQLIWGGHPSITPLIRFVLSKMHVDLKKHVTLYQSLYYKDKFPQDNSAFENIVLTQEAQSPENSLEIMRNVLIKENDFKIGIFIGGMEGILVEYELFAKYHPHALVLPIASTGAAAQILYYKLKPNLNNRLLNDYAYMALFRDLLSEYI